MAHRGITYGPTTPIFPRYDQAMTAEPSAGARPDLARGIRLPREERRTQLMAAAREVFVECGYHAAAMDDIADRASVSKPVLYQHFPSKLDLYLALLDEGIETLINSVRHALESTHDNKKRVHATMTAYFAFVAEPAGASRLVFESDLTREPAVAEKVLQVDQACSQMVSAVIVEDTGLSSAQAELLASGLLGMAEAAARRWLRDCVESPDTSIGLEEAADLVGSLAWRGIRGFPLSHPPSA